MISRVFGVLSFLLRVCCAHAQAKHSTPMLTKLRERASRNAAIAANEPEGDSSIPTDINFYMAYHMIYYILDSIEIIPLFLVESNTIDPAVTSC